jgi:hypothetical protein
LANRSRQTFLKRQKERARQEKQRLKAEKRQQRKADRDTTDPALGEDPDIAGIVPGPQPHAWDVVDVLTDDEKAALEDER